MFASVLLFTFFEVFLWGTAVGDPTVGPLIPMRKIPQTDLFTGIFYQIRMKSFPTGIITWTNEKTKQSEGNYVQLDKNPENLSHYRKGEKWFTEVQWAWEPSEVPDFYVLRHREAPGGLVAVKYEAWAHHKLIILVKDKAKLTGGGKYAKGGAEREDVFMKPIMAEECECSDFKYQLQMKKNPSATITFTELQYGDYNHYIQLSDNQNHVFKYQKGHEWFDHTLFQFTPEPGNLTLHGYITHLEFTEEGKQILDKYEDRVKKSVVKTIVLPKTTSSNLYNLTGSMEQLDTTKATLHFIEPNFPQKLEISGSFSIPALHSSEFNQVYNKFKILPAVAVALRAVDSGEDFCRENEVVLDILHDNHSPGFTKQIKQLEDKDININMMTTTLDGVEFPIRAAMVISGEGDRMTVNGESTRRGPMPVDIIVNELIKSGEKRENMKVIDDDKVLLFVPGVIKGTFTIGMDVEVVAVEDGVEDIPLPPPPPSAIHGEPKRRINPSMSNPTHLGYV